MDGDSSEAKRAKIEENRLKALEKLKQKMLLMKGDVADQLGAVSGSGCLVGRSELAGSEINSVPAQVNPVKTAANSVSFQSHFNRVQSSQSNKPSLSSQSNKQPSIEPSSNSLLQSNTSQIEVDFELLQSGQIKISPLNTASRTFLLQSFPKRSFPTTGSAILVQLEDFLTAINCLSVRQKLKLKASLEKCYREVCRFNALPPIQSQVKDPSLADFCAVNALLPFQVEGVLFGISRGGRLLLADDMGLGKTLQAAAIAFFYRAEWPLLVVCPSSLTGSWKQALQECYRTFSVEVCAFWDSKEFVSGASTSNLSTSHVCILSYDLAAKNCPKLRDLAFKVVIVDESHMLKNHSSKRTKSLAPFLASASRLMLLSGTPALSRPIELFPQLQLLNSRLFSNYTDYGMRYCAGYKAAFGYNFQGSSLMQELQYILDKTVMIRRTKEQVLHWLPSKVRKQIFLHVDNSKTPTTTAAFTTREAELESQMEAFQLSESSMQQFQASTPKKLASILRYLNDLIVEGPKQLGGTAEAPKILLFAHYKSTLDALEDWTASVHLPSIRIDGETCASKRQSLCNAFQTDNRIKVALLSITAASTGLTLTASSLVIFAELFWNPGTLIQAEDRAHRIGQKDSVVVHYLLGKGTFDDVMWPILVKKMKTLQAVGLGKNEFGADGSGAEMQQHDATIVDSRQKTLLQFMVPNGTGKE